MGTNETIADILREMRERASRREISPDAYGVADRIEAAVARELSKNGPNNGPEIGQFTSKPDWGVHEALAFANTLANHGWTRDANPDAASSCIYALCRHLRATGNAAAMREALERAIDAIQTMIALYDEEHTAAVQIGATWKRSDTSEVNAIIEQARAALAAPPEPASNAAAMRKALNQLRDWALLDINENAIRSDEPNYRKLVDGIVEITDAALAAPARNSDRTKDEAEDLFKERFGRPWTRAEDELAAWLFAPAKGGAE